MIRGEFITLDAIIDFKESEWVIRLESGDPVFDSVYFPNDIFRALTLAEYSELLRLNRMYLTDYRLLYDFRLEALPFGEYPDIVIQDFLKNKYARIVKELYDNE